MCVHVHLYVYVMNATMDPSRVDVSFVEVLVSLMLIIAKNARNKKKIGMAARRLSIWAVLKLTCSMNVKNTDLKNDDCD